MKKFVSILVMFCFISVFTAKADIYSGPLKVTVGQGEPEINTQTVNVTFNGSTATLEIYDFTYGWIYCGNILLTATLNGTQITGVTSVSAVGGLVTIDSAQFNSGYLDSTKCQINLTVSALGDSVNIDFDGNK